MSDSRHDFADEYGAEYGRYDGQETVPPPIAIPDSREDPLPPLLLPVAPTPLSKKQQNQKRVFGRPFQTAGWIVVLVSSLVAIIQLTMFAFVVNLSHNP